MAALPEPWKSLRAKIEALTERIRKLENAASNKFSGTGLSVPEDGVTQVDGNLVVLGDFTALGKISNDALVNPVLPGDVSFGVENFSITAGTYTQIGSATRTVPDGFTRALVNASVWMFARNPNTTGGVDGTGTDAIFCYVRVTGSDGDTDSKPKGQGISGFGGFTTATSGLGKLKTGLTPGSSLTFKAFAASSSQDLAADVQNSLDMMGTVLWLR
jgi:hypothetical protein